MKKLIRRLGAEGGLALIYLFLWSAVHRSDGNLAGLSDEDIELSIDWTGGNGKFVAEAAAVGFLDGEEGSRSLHDWSEHNPWAAGAEQRSERSKYAALCKQYGRVEADRMMPNYAARTPNAQSGSAESTPNSANGMPSALPNGDTRVPLAAFSSAPSPSPSPIPSPIPNTPQPPKGGKRARGPKSDVGDPEGFADWYALYGRKDARADAVKAWTQKGLDADQALRDRAMAAVKAWRWSEDRSKNPLPASWLRGERWADEAVAVAVATVAKAQAEAGFPASATAVPWWMAAGFDHPDEAANFGCREWNAKEFRDGKRAAVEVTA
ncbi:MAG: hypothetical protein Q8N06_02860 [Hydrogenophaga sp.]|nr:hypothetical protein [Hydrogenophaga sp.]